MPVSPRRGRCRRRPAAGRRRRRGPPPTRRSAGSTVVEGGGVARRSAPSPARKSGTRLPSRLSDLVRDSKAARRTPARTHASARRNRTASPTAVMGVLAPRLTTRQPRACSIAPKSSSGRSCSSCGGHARTTVRTCSPETGIRSSPSTPRKELDTKCSCSTPSSPLSQPSPTSRSTGIMTRATVSSTPETRRDWRSTSRTVAPSRSRTAARTATLAASGSARVFVLIEVLSWPEGPRVDAT